jgi:hypothetical protein
MVWNNSNGDFSPGRAGALNSGSGGGLSSGCGSGGGGWGDKRRFSPFGSDSGFGLHRH